MTYQWIWDGGRVCVDFVNTMRDRWTSGHEMLRTPAELRRWLGLAGLCDDARVTENQLLAARRLREQIDRVLRTAATGHAPAAEDITGINNRSRDVPLPELVPRDDGTVSVRRVPGGSAVDGALALIAADAIALLEADPHPKLKVCALDTCGLRYWDRSPAGNRQWCSMTRCGNRQKARQHYQRRRTQPRD